MSRKVIARPVVALDLLILAEVLVAAGCTFAALFAAWHWPLVGDTSLMRYVVVLLKSGRAPYSQIIDINLPGSYLLEAVAMRVFGSGAVGLRLYDAALSAVICTSAFVLSKPSLRARICALAGGCLIVLIHLRDGLVQAGQRDYALLAIVLLAYALLLRGPFAARRAGLWLFSLLAGCTLTIKPTMAMLILLPLYMSVLQHDRAALTAKKIGSAAIVSLLPLGAMLCWLQAWHAIPAFLSSMDLLRRSHVGLAHKTFFFLLDHSIRLIAVLIVLGFLLLASRGFKIGIEQRLLLFGSAAGLVSFMLQGKGFSYQRYPLLGLLIVVIFSLVADELGGVALNRSLAVAVLSLSCLWWAPRFALSVSQ